MPDERDYMNQLLRQRSTPAVDPNADNATINRLIRETAGLPPPGDHPSQQVAQQRQARQPVADPRSATRRLLAQAAKPVVDSEPVAGVDSLTAYDEWLWSRPVVDLLDADGRLPGEPHFDPTTTSLIQGADWDVEQAHAARRRRWQALGRM
jgi:hypothetical protein